MKQVTVWLILFATVIQDDLRLQIKNIFAKWAPKQRVFEFSLTCIAVDNQSCSSLSSCGACVQQFVRSFQYFLLKVQICYQGPKVTKKKHLILVRYLMSCQQKRQQQNLRGCGISLAFSFLVEMRLRDNSKSNIYWQLVDGLQRRQFKTFAGFFS